MFQIKSQSIDNTYISTYDFPGFLINHPCPFLIPAPHVSFSLNINRNVQFSPLPSHNPKPPYINSPRTPATVSPVHPQTSPHPSIHTHMQSCKDSCVPYTHFHITRQRRNAHTRTRMRRGGNLVSQREIRRRAREACQSRRCAAAAVLTRRER